MTDTNVTELRPSPHQGEGSSRRTAKDPTGALRAKRFRRKRKAPAVTAPVTLAVTQPEIQSFENANDFNSSVTVERYGKEKVNKSNDVTPFVQPQWQAAHTVTGERRLPASWSRDFIDAAAYMTAIALATTAAYFSIRGMTALFPGAPGAIIAMAATMEAAKLVTAGWLARRWRSTAWVWRSALTVFVLGLAIINGVGVFSQLVAAHVGERGEAAASIEIQTAGIDARIEQQTALVTDIDIRLRQIDSAVSEATKRGRTTGAMSIMEAQRRTRAGLASERERAEAALAGLKAERATVAARGRQAETEAAPIHYVAAVLGVDDSEEAIRWLIALMVLCCDPLAIALTAAVSARRT